MEVKNPTTTLQSTSSADEPDWRSSCVQPAKDTRVQTLVIY
jgi:hypothetical protein